MKECTVPLAQKGLKLETAEPKKIFAYFCVSEYCAAFLSFLSRKEQINNILWWPHMFPYARVWGSLIHNYTRICLCLNQPQFLWHSTKFSDLVHIYESPLGKTHIKKSCFFSGRWHGPLSHWCREDKTLVVQPLKKNLFLMCVFP